MPRPDHHSHAERGPQRRKRFFGHGDLRLVVLDMLARRASHAYELVRSIESLTHGHYVPSTGVIYPTLDHLQQHGFITISDEENGRREIAITDAGRQHLVDQQDDLEQINQRIKARTIGHDLRRHPEMKRALDNIKSALDSKVNQNALADEELQKVVAIIDEAAARIRDLS